MKTIAIYHKDCTDGTTAAAVVLKKYPDALVFPLSHGFEPKELEEVIAVAAPGDRILTVDCVIGAKEFLAKGFPVTSIDHHAGAQAEYEALAKSNPAFTFVFNNAQSGASLTWSTLFPNEPIPELIKRVQDQDLWQWKFEDTKDVSNSLYIYTNEPKEVLALFTEPLATLKKNGEILTKYSAKMIDNAANKTEAIMVKVGEYTVPFYNITVYKSDCGNVLSTEQDKTVGLFTIDGEFVKISFRSLDRQEPSALAVASVIGGGGHRNAAGARMSLMDFLKAIVRL
ncbi:MAG: hypothetical protein RLZZ67_355 [Candidatus Parcubacteria bacterium]|jgi:oligoribonuclease NrnB/cAMP/cGMP phosphodiesterase (DHH superfamily)